MQEQKTNSQRKVNNTAKKKRSVGSASSQHPNRASNNANSKQTAHSANRAVRPPLSNDERRRQRAERARKKRQRRNRILALISTIIVLIVGIILCLTVFFHVRSVTVEGKTAYSAETITETSGIHIGENMFLMRSKKVAQTIEHNLPYIESVKVKRKLSGEIQLIVKSAIVRAAIPNGETFILLSDKGKVLETEAEALPEHVMQLTESEVKTATSGEQIAFSSDVSREIYNTMLGVLIQNDFTQNITKLSLGDKNNISMTYADRIKVKLGTLESVADKMDFVKAALLQNDEKTPDFRGEIDFSIDKKAFLHPEGETKKTPAEPTAAVETTVAETTTAA